MAKPFRSIRLSSNRAAACLCALLLLAGCQERSHQLRIAVVPKAAVHIFWQSVHAGCHRRRARSESRSAVEQPRGRNRFQPPDPDRGFHDRAARGRPGRGSLRPHGAERILDRAAASRIPVTIFDSGVDSTNYMTFVATDNYQAGEMAGRKLAGLIGGKGKVAIVLHMPGSYSTMERERGFEDVVKKEFPGIQIVATQYGMSDRSKSLAAAENMLVAHPDLSAMFCSTEPSATGTSIALKERGMAGKMRFVAFDSSENMIEDLKAGVIDAMVVQDPFKIGYEAVKTLVDKLHGNPPPKQVDLRATVVTKADLQKPEIHALLFPDLAKYMQ